MSIGHDIIDEIGKQAMFAVAHPDPEEAHIFVWSSGAGEQLHALVMDSKEVRELRADKARLDAVLARGFPCSWIAPYDYFPQDPIKGRAAIDAAKNPS
jgi:hypothetical protein